MHMELHGEMKPPRELQGAARSPSGLTACGGCSPPLSQSRLLQVVDLVVALQHLQPVVCGRSLGICLELSDAWGPLTSPHGGRDFTVSHVVDQRTGPNCEDSM